MTDVPGECMVWEGYRNAHGYGRVILRGGIEIGYVHRLVWQAAHGCIPDGFCVLHRCDNPPCYRLDHLFLGTQADNVADMIAKGRCRAGVTMRAKTHCPRGHPYSGPNLYVTPTGKRMCRTCMRASEARHRQRRANAPH